MSRLEIVCYLSPWILVILILVSGYAPYGGKYTPLRFYSRKTESVDYWFTLVAYIFIIGFITFLLLMMRLYA